MKAILAALALSLAAAGVSYAQDGAEAQAEAPQFSYAIVRENVRIPFAGRTIQGFEVGRDRNSVIFRASGRRYYRGELDSFCAHNLRWDERIGLDRRRSGPSFGRGDIVLIEGHRCMLQTLDEIADPREAHIAADAARRAARD